MRKLERRREWQQLKASAPGGVAVHGERPAARAALLRLPVREAWPTPLLQPIDETAHPLVSGSLALLEQPELEIAPRPVAVRRHILIVEDDPRTAGVLRNALELDGDPAWALEVAGEGQQALELAAQTTPDLVLLDVWLPGLDGAEVYRRLRAGRPAGRTRVLFLTAGTSLDLYRRGIDDGVLLRKPFDIQELVGLVRALLAD
jgi:CheY-like chemotaxis protein